jgi:methionyl-tRNA formyltransferase
MINNKSHIIVFFGSGSYSIPVVEMLHQHGLKLVLTTETSGPLVSFLEKNTIPYLSTKVTGDLPADRQEFKKELWQKVKDVQPTLGVLASFGAIIPQDIIDIFPQGIWNIHPSLLPKFKGPSPIQYTLLSGDTETGVTIISLDEQVDHGPILAQEKLSITGTETTKELLNTLFTKGADLIKKLLQQDYVEATPQNHTKETWSEKITKESGYVDIENPPSREHLDRMVRAYHPWPGVWTKWKKENPPADRQGGETKIVKLLPNEQIQVEGKKPMFMKDFVNGYGEEGETLLKKLGY